MLTNTLLFWLELTHEIMKLQPWKQSWLRTSLLKTISTLIVTTFSFSPIHGTATLNLQSMLMRSSKSKQISTATGPLIHQYITTWKSRRTAPKSLQLVLSKTILLIFLDLCTRQKSLVQAQISSSACRALARTVLLNIDVCSGATLAKQLVLCTIGMLLRTILSIRPRFPDFFSNSIKHFFC